MKIKTIRNWLYTLAAFSLTTLQASNKLPDIDAPAVSEKIHEIMQSHASHKTLTPELIRRAFNNYLDLLDPIKTYFIESDIHQWLEPSDELVNQVLRDIKQNRYTVFEDMHHSMLHAIERRHEIDKQITSLELPKHVNAQEFKDLKWAQNEQELQTRILRLKSLQYEAASKLSAEMKEISLQRIEKRQAKDEEEITTNDAVLRERLILGYVIKSIASSLDAHTYYFTPGEAAQFLINVQQRLFGIGAQLRDDINGFTIVRVVEGGPAAQSKQLRAKDRIVAVNGEPVVGMDIVDAVDLIRGEENTPVILTIIRETMDGTEKHDEKLEITVPRGEVVLKESRYESSYEPYGDGAIGYLKLFSFYQDPTSASATDLENEIDKLKKNNNLKGLILDLRYNSGGMLSQAVDVTGLFIKKGIVVSVKDEKGDIQHLRDLDEKTAFDGPLIVLVNRASASASEIVAQTLQDYGRAIVVGDDHTFGKGSFQTFTLSSPKIADVNPQGEYKVTRGRYYTVSGKTPQLTGVISDIVAPGLLSDTEIGESFSKYPLENDRIKENFEDDLSDVPYLQRDRIRFLYKFDLQTKQNLYGKYLEKLKENSQYRIENSKNYQNLLKEIKKKDNWDEDNMEQFGSNDLQLTESYNIMKDLILLMQSKEKETKT